VLGEACSIPGRTGNGIGAEAGIGRDCRLGPTCWVGAVTGVPPGGVGANLPPWVVQGVITTPELRIPMQSSAEDAHNAVPETLLVAQVECGPGSRSYSWSSLRAAAKSAEAIEQLIAILYCRASTGDLLIA